jgi:hypothetical protein
MGSTSDDDRRERLQRFDAEIDRLTAAVELGRKVIPFARPPSSRRAQSFWRSRSERSASIQSQ